MPNDYSRERLQGSILSMLTFTNDDYSLDLDSQRKHVRWLIDQGMVEGKCVHLIAGGARGDVHARRGRVPRVGRPHHRRGQGVAPTMVMVSELSARARRESAPTRPRSAPTSFSSLRRTTPAD